jgi:hypothetical protein
MSFVQGSKTENQQKQEGEMKIENRSNAVDYRPGLCMKVAERLQGNWRETSTKQEGRKNRKETDTVVPVEIVKEHEREYLNEGARKWDPYVLRVAVNELLAISLLPAEQLRQASQAAAHLQELVSQELVSRGAAADIDAETDAQEGLEFLAELLGLLETRGSVGCDEVEGLEGLFV